MDLEILETAADVFRALGENPGVSEVTGAKAPAISNWRKFGAFPSNTYVAMTEALHARGKTAPAALWGMKVGADRENAS